jgi:toluene monooxygenase system ferredoxin subunit
VTLPDGRLVLLVGTDAGVFATCADCPHQDTPLVDGSVEGTILTCPVHFWQWDMRTGEPIGLAELPLPTFQVKVESGYLFVRRTPRG